MTPINAKQYPHLARATERGLKLHAEHRDGWARLAELRRTRQDQAADRLTRQLLGIKGDPMPEDVKAALRAKRAAMTDEEKKAERDQRRTNRILQRLAARATGPKNPNPQEDAMSKKTAAKKSKATAKAKTPRATAQVRDPRIPPSGETLTREYKGQKIEVKVVDQEWEVNGKKVMRTAFEYLGVTYPSLTALALRITGFKAISGPAFFGLWKPAPLAAAVSK